VESHVREMHSVLMFGTECTHKEQLWMDRACITVEACKCRYPITDAAAAGCGPCTRPAVCASRLFATESVPWNEANCKTQLRGYARMPQRALSELWYDGTIDLSFQPACSQPIRRSFGICIVKYSQAQVQEYMELTSLNLKHKQTSSFSSHIDTNLSTQVHTAKRQYLSLAFSLSELEFA
jgi:hypothetical protein